MMAIRRTKKEKETTQVRRAETLSYVFSSDKKIIKESSTKKVEASDLLRFDVQTVKNDLWRTIAASVVVFGILIALYLRF